MNWDWTTWALILAALGIGAYYFMGEEGTQAQSKIERLEQQAQEYEEEARRRKSVAEKLKEAESARQQYKQLQSKASSM